MWTGLYAAIAAAATFAARTVASKIWRVTTGEQVLYHRHIGEQFTMLKRARDAEPRDLARRAA